MTREEWLKKPINERAEIIATATPENVDKYINVCRRLYSRFSKGGAGVVVEIGGNPAPYRILTDMAWMKYMAGVKPCKN